MVFLALLGMGKIFVVYTCCTKGNDTLFMYYEHDEHHAYEAYLIEYLTSLIYISRPARCPLCPRIEK